MVALVIHGGAGVISRKDLTADIEKKFIEGIQDAINAGFSILAKKGSAIDAVEASVITLENNELFNAGKGSVFTTDATHEMEASIMCGRRIDAGAVCGIKNVKNPIALSRIVLEKSKYLFLSGNGAEKLALEHQLTFEPDEYFHTAFRRIQLMHEKSGKIKNTGTVGAVALDYEGNLAAATSTGGLNNKNYGRIGDSPIIGAGTYANNSTCAVSCTGDGEYFIRSVAAYNVSALMEYGKYSLHEACDFVINNKLKNLGGEGGLIALDKKGNIEMIFNSEGMYRGFRKDDKEQGIFIY